MQWASSPLYLSEKGTERVKGSAWPYSICSDFSSVACTGKLSVRSSGGHTELRRSSAPYLCNSNVPATGSTLHQTADRGAIRKYTQSCEASLCTPSVPAAVRTDESVSAVLFWLVLSSSMDAPAPNSPIEHLYFFSGSFLPQPRLFKMHARSRECHKK